MFGVVDTDTIKYGWATYHIDTPDNFIVQQRAAQELIQFTWDKTRFESLLSVCRSVMEDGTKPSFRFHAPGDLYQLSRILPVFRERGDVKGAAHQTAKALFSPWK